MSIRSKKDLEVELSKLNTFSKPKVQLEQYQTPSTIAADWIWFMALEGEISGRTFLDAACGTGILGFGLLLMGATKVYFLDKDGDAIQIAQENYNNLDNEYEIGDAHFLTSDISLFDETVDCVIQNPPFGTKLEHIDKLFLEKAFSVAPVVFSMHKYSTKSFVEAISKDHYFTITHHWRYSFPIKSTFSFHTKSVEHIDVGLWRMVRKQN
jgi:putative methylase